MENNFIDMDQNQNKFENWFTMAELDIKILELLYGEALPNENPELQAELNWV